MSELEKAIQSGDDARVLRVAEKMLKSSPNDETARHAKVVALIKLEKFEEALKELKEMQDVTMEQAYCYYRLNQLDKALSLLKDETCHLRAQILYRMEQFSQAAKIYKQLLENLPETDPFFKEAQANYLAAQAAALLSKQEVKVDPIQPDSYEGAYNLGCLYLGMGQLEKASDLLELARDLGRKAMLNDEVTEDEIKQELAIIAVQLAYVYQLQGKDHEAHELIQDIIKSRVADPLVSAVTTNNLVTIRGDTDLLDSAKRLKNLSPVAWEVGKLTKAQRRTLAANHALLHLRLGKFADAKSKLDELDDKDLANRLETALTLREHGLDAAIESAQKRGDHLSLSQLLLEKGEAEQAKKALLSVKQPSPTILAAAARICEDLGQADEALNILQKVGKSDGSSILQKQLAAFKLRSNAPKEAAEIYSQILTSNPNDGEALARLISASAQFDLDKAEELFEKLGVSMEIASTDALETKSPTLPRQIVKKVVKKKRRHPLRLPKNYDPSIPPDPERWLPKTQRSTYAKKGKKKLAQTRGPQGAAVTGGGLGGTGSARIAGMSVESNVEEKESPVVEQVKKAPPPPKKKKGKGKW